MSCSALEQVVTDTVGLARCLAPTRRRGTLPLLFPDRRMSAGPVIRHRVTGAQKRPVLEEPVVNCQWEAPLGCSRAVEGGIRGVHPLPSTVRISAISWTLAQVQVPPYSVPSP